jgi:hypothetical protein
LLEAVDVALPRRRGEGVEELSMLAAAHRSAPVDGHAPAGAAGQLAGIGLGGPQELGDAWVRVVERLVEHEGGALGRREALEQHQEASGHFVVVLGGDGRVVRRGDRLR